MRIIFFTAAALFLSVGLGGAEDSPIPNEPLFHRVVDVPVKNFTQKKREVGLRARHWATNAQASQSAVLVKALVAAG